MMSLGPMGSGAGGNSSSSTSNLSALAPPFTVDRLNPKPNSNPSLHYSDPLYMAEPYSQGWSYASPSAPIPKLAFESTGITNVPSSEDYRTISPPTSTHWSSLNSGTKASASAFAYGGSEVKHYYSPYVPPLVGGEDSLLVKDGESHYDVGPVLGPSLKSQIDYTLNLWDVNYGAPWVDNMGFDDGKLSKREEVDGSSFEKVKLGGSGPHSYGNQLSEGGFCTEKNKKNSTEDSGVSYKNLNHASDGEIHTGSASVLQTKDKSCHEHNLGFVPYDSNQTCISEYISTYPGPYYKNFSNEQNSFEKSFKHVDKPFIGPVSAVMSSPTVVIRPPPATNGKSGQRAFSGKLARFENVESTEFCSKPNSQIKEGSFQTNLFNLPKQGNGLISSSELESPLDLRVPLDHKMKARFESQLPEVNILGGFNMACDSSNVQAVNSTDNVQVDSPCWKGASSLTQFSLMDMEASNLNHAKKNMDTYYGVDLEKHEKNLHSVIDSDQGFPQKADERSKSIEKNECGAICSTKEHSLFGGVKGIKTGNDTKSSKTECLISEGAVAVHTAEKVLASPASQEDAAEHTMLPDRKLNMPTVLRAMHNLSELLLFHLSSDVCFLEKENTETIENIVHNLSSCLNYNANVASKKLEPNSAAVSHASDKSPKLHHVVTTLGSPRHMHEEEKEYRFPGKKDEKSPILSSLGDDLDITRDDDMTKAIKKVLEENLHINEEKNSRAFFYRNLWLDAEAKLCSISYKARFDRMKLQMEQINMKAPQAIDDTEEIISEICNTASELGLNGHDGPILKSTIQNLPFSLSGPPDGVESSVIARFNISKSREENMKPINTADEQQKPKMVDNYEHGDPVMTRFNILKSHEKSAKLISTDEGIQSKMIAGGFSSSDWCVGPCIMSLPEVGNFNVGPEVGMFGPYARGAGYETLEAFHLSVTNDPVICSFTNSRMMMEHSSLGRRDSSSSNCEHVMKDDLSWKNS
ncbi:hypothetical protein OROGR_022522 [Orobanche gracilis]